MAHDVEALQVGLDAQVADELARVHPQSLEGQPVHLHAAAE